MYLRKFSFLYILHSLNSNLALVTFFSQLETFFAKIQTERIFIAQL